MKWHTLLLVCLLMTVYMVLGGVMFHFLEKGEEQRTKVNLEASLQQFLRNHTCVTEERLEMLAQTVIQAYDMGVLPFSDNTKATWDFIGAMFYSSTIITTIGYGNLTPVTAWGQAATVLYAIFGIPLFLVFLTALSEKMNNTCRNVQRKLSKVKGPHSDTKAAKASRSLFMLSVGLLFTLFLPSLLFAHYVGWTYGESLYYCIITMSTIGFGDYVPGSPTSTHNHNRRTSWVGFQFFVTIWLMLGLTIWLTIVNHLTELLEIIISHRSIKPMIDPPIQTGMAVSKVQLDTDPLTEDSFKKQDEENEKTVNEKDDTTKEIYTPSGNNEEIKHPNLVT